MRTRQNEARRKRPRWAFARTRRRIKSSRSNQTHSCSSTRCLTTSPRSGSMHWYKGQNLMPLPCRLPTLFIVCVHSPMLVQTGGGSSVSQRAAAARERLKLQLQQRCSNPACGTHTPPSASASAQTSEEPQQSNAASASAAASAPAAPSGPIVLSECSRCHQARYCSKACQVAHWDAHKAPCKEARRVIEEAAALALAAPTPSAAAAAVSQ
jgi:hypothetical protein